MPSLHIPPHWYGPCFTVLHGNSNHIRGGYRRDRWQNNQQASTLSNPAAPYWQRHYNNPRYSSAGNDERLVSELRLSNSQEALARKYIAFEEVD